MNLNRTLLSALALTGTLTAAGCSSDVTPLGPAATAPPTLVSAPFETAEAAVTLGIGDTYQVDLAKRAKGAAVPMTSVRWTSSNEFVASVSSTGLVTAVGTGDAVISATRGIHVVSVAIQVGTCRLTPLPVGTTTGEITTLDCWYAPANRYSDYYSVSSPNGEVMRLTTSGIPGVAGVKAASADFAQGTIYGARNSGAPFRVIGNGDPLQFYFSGFTATTLGEYTVTRSVDSQTHTCAVLTFVVPGASFAADMQPSNACQYNVAFTDYPPAMGKPLLAHRYWVRVDEIKPYTVTVGGLSWDFDPAVVIFPNILNGAPVASAFPTGSSPTATRSVTFTPSTVGYYLVEVSTGLFRNGETGEEWVNHTGPFTVSVSR